MAHPLLLDIRQYYHQDCDVCLCLDGLLLHLLYTRQSTLLFNLSYIRHIYGVTFPMYPVVGQFPVPGVLPPQHLPQHPPYHHLKAEVVDQPLWRWLFRETNQPGWVPGRKV